MILSTLVLAALSGQFRVPPFEKVPPKVAIVSVAPGPGATWSGKVTLKLRVKVDQATFKQATIGVQVDGVLTKVPGGTTNHYLGSSRKDQTDFDYTDVIDTTRLANGPHLLSLITYAIGMEDRRNYLRAFDERIVQVDNGHAPRDVRASASEMYLAAGESSSVSARRRFTDGKEESLKAAAVAFSSDAPSVATVDAAGRVSAVSDGIATLTLKAEGGEAKARVIVAPHRGVPHFGRDGSILTAYDPKRSQFVASVFWLDGDELDKTPGLAARVKADGITTLSCGFYRNPAGNGGEAAAQKAVKSNRQLVDKVLASAEKHDMNLMLSGDELARRAVELKDTITSPYARKTIRESLARLAASRRVLGIEVVDEISALWGHTPFPTDGRWAKKGLPDDAIRRLIDILGPRPGRPAITWPVLGIHGAETMKNWMGDPAFSDYSSLYFDPASWDSSERGRSLPDMLFFQARKVRDAADVLPRDTPKILIGSISGPTYIKGAPGGDYSPKTDRVTRMGVSPEAVAASLFNAGLLGMAGVREYGFDNALRKRVRLERKVGQSVPVGAEPFRVGADRWRAMAAALKLLHTLEPQLFGAPMTAPDLGDSISAGARQGPNGRLLMIANFRENAERVSVDLSPYQIAGGPPVVRYRLLTESLATSRADAAHDRLVLKPGECVAYVFLNPK